MATLRTRWLLSILLVNLPNCCAAGLPAAPSPPKCYIPCDEKLHNCADIHCAWDPRLDPQIQTNYSLHWEPANSEEGHVIIGTSLSVIINRAHFNHGDLRVWVQAKNQHGSTSSEIRTFNTAEIIKLPPPKVTLSSHQDSLEISWDTNCDEYQLSLGSCDVRYRTEEDQAWHEVENDRHSYTVDSPKPGTVYEFQVRCSCRPGEMSNWNAIHRIRSQEMDYFWGLLLPLFESWRVTGKGRKRGCQGLSLHGVHAVLAPVGELDVWRDCGMSQASSDCALTWKELPLSQAHGLILGYEVRLSYNNGTQVLVNASTAEPNGWLVCEEMQCHFPSSLKDVSSVNVSAYNTRGATVPSYHAMPIPGKEKNEQTIHLKMNEDNLTVSWDQPSQLSDNLKEYVVQYKQAGCPPGQGFDWIRVKNSQTTGTFKGQYKESKSTYQVSLFTVSYSNKVHHLSSVIGYSLQGTPSRVPSFKVFSIAATHVTLFWEPVPLSKQNGGILYYQIVLVSGTDRQKVYNVSAYPQQENKTFKLENLSPGQEYEVLIRAVTAAGPGANITTKFETDHHEDFVYLIPVVLGIICFVVFCVLVALCSVCRGENKACPLVPSYFYYKVPDARNSHIFRHMKHQINDPLAWLCIPIYEPHPKISLLEVVEIQVKSSLEKTSDPNGLTRPMVGDGCSQMDCQEGQKSEPVPEECHRTDRRYGRKEYSKMVDSDEERDGEEEHTEDCWSSSEEEKSTLGYEKHFMPTASEVREV